MKYSVTVRQEISYMLHIEADSQEAAERIALERFEDGEGEESDSSCGYVAFSTELPGGSTA